MNPMKMNIEIPINERSNNYTLQNRSIALQDIHLLQEGISHAENKNCIDNVGIHQMKASARRFGVLKTDWKSIEYEIDTPLNPSILSNELPRGVEIFPFQNSLLPAIFEYDFFFRVYERKSIIEASCHEENCKTLVAMKDGK
ncbi:n-acetyltransferase domain-containing protein [Trichonephila clavipes]|nr:n-acetyltransferase domain-containing protein [Trichonephila clavipes]